MAHFLNLRVLADASVDDYLLLSFEGREAISTCFDYRLELITTVDQDLSTWIGKLCEFDVSPTDAQQRVFAGRIYAARRVETGDDTRIQIQVGPAYQALSYAQATHFIQDQTSLDIFEAMTADVLGLTKKVSVSPAPPKRGYAVRYDETEFDFLDRLLAQDGIMYFFEYASDAGVFKHRMIVTTSPSDYLELPGGAARFQPSSANGSINRLERKYRSAPRKHSHVSHNVNKLDTPFLKATSATDTWGAVYTHPQETIGYEAVDEGDLGSRQLASDQARGQAADQIEGASTEPTFAAGARVEIEEASAAISPKRILITSVQHSAIDRWMMPDATPGEYRNTFTAIDARFIFRPPVGAPTRVAPGPLLGTVALDGKTQGEAVIDDQWRVPVEISGARDYSSNWPKYVWIPVKQQWAHSTHGAQFFPRIGTRVIIDFLYGNPDLPLVTGTVYTPSQAYPFDPTKTPTQSGWRSITDKNGKVVQEFRFEDKPDSEEIYLFTGRDYRRMIENDDWGTVKNNQTLVVEKDRSREVKGQENVKVTQTRTIKVTDKNLLESDKEIELKVGSSSIKLTQDGIEISATNITVKAAANLKMSGGAMFELKGTKGEVNAAAILTVKGSMVMIN